LINLIKFNKNLLAIIFFMAIKASMAFSVNVDASTLRLDVAAGIKGKLAANGVNSAYIMDSQLASLKLGGRHLVTFGESGSFIGESTSQHPEKFNGNSIYYNYDVNEMLRLGREDKYKYSICEMIDHNRNLRYVSGGRWITSILALPGSSSHALAIYHREYDWCKAEMWNSKFHYGDYVTKPSRSPEAYTTGLLYTTDGGRTWVDRGNILTGARDLEQDQFLGTPGASGIIGSDGYLYIYYFDYGGRWGDDLRIARSTAPVTQVNIGSVNFRKRSSSANNFSAPARGSSLGKGTGTGWLEKVSGLAWSSNNNTPHVHWNYGINSYVMTYKNWSENPNGSVVTLKVAFSSNLLDWSDSQDLLKIINPNGNHVYASIIGDSSSVAGSKASIYFNAGKGHQMNRVDVTFGYGSQANSKPGEFNAGTMKTVAANFSSYSFPSKFMLKVPGKGNMCVDDGGGTTRGQSQFIFGPCDSNSKNQHFSYDAVAMLIKNPNKNNLCIDDGGGVYAGQTKFHLWDCDANNSNQNFIYDFDLKQFKNPNKNNLCMDDGGGWSAGQTRFHLWNCDANNPSQRFEIVPLFMLKAQGKNNLCVDDGGGISKGQTQFHLWSCDKNNQNQHFTYDASTKQLKNPTKNLCVDDGGGWYPGQTKFHLWDCVAGHANQQFIYDSVKNSFRNPNKNNLCMDDGGGVHPGQTKMHLWTCDSNNHNQLFEVISF
jgi:hypothetical protein